MAESFPRIRGRNHFPGQHFATDHIPFNDINLPGFQFIQDPIEYDTRTHHTNMDVLDRIQEDDLKQASVIMAAFVYNAATMDDRFPRKPKVAVADAARKQ